MRVYVHFVAMLMLLVTVSADARQIVVEIPDMPEDVNGVTIHVHGWIVHDPLAPEWSEISHARALDMLRDAGATIVDALAEGVDLLIIGSVPFPSESLDDDEMDPTVVEAHAKAVWRQERWGREVPELIERAAALGARRVSATSWFIAQHHPDMSHAERTTRLRLATRISVNFEDNRLVNVFDYFKNVSGTRLKVDWPAFHKGGVTENTPITLSRVSLLASQALALILEQVGIEGQPYSVDAQGLVHIPAKVEANKPASDHVTPAALRPACAESRLENGTGAF